MASLDLKDAYYSVYIAPEDRKFLRLEFNDQLLQYTALSNGLSSCPRTFTKILNRLCLPFTKKDTSQLRTFTTYICKATLLMNA